MQQTVIGRIEEIAQDVVSVDLRGADGALARWQPGAHIDLALPNWLTRQYSLCGDPADRGRYQVAVRHERLSRGGSEYVHRYLRQGRPLLVSLPRNHFPLESAPEYLFLAGGIGITPIRPMLRSAVATGAAVRLIYAGRSRASMPFADELLATYGKRGRVMVTREDGRPDFAALAAGTSARALVYCCGPAPMLAAVEAAFPAQMLRTERFRPSAREFGPGTAFEAVCVRSGRTIEVPPGKPLLDALNHAGLPVPSGCRQGVCGSCEVSVLGGELEHRDDIGAPEGRMYPCVSRARSVLMLDL